MCAGLLWYCLNLQEQQTVRCSIRAGHDTPRFLWAFGMAFFMENLPEMLWWKCRGAVYANSKEIIDKERSKPKLLEKRKIEVHMWILILLPPVSIWTRNTV